MDFKVKTMYEIKKNCYLLRKFWANVTFLKTKTLTGWAFWLKSNKVTVTMQNIHGGIYREGGISGIIYIKVGFIPKPFFPIRCMFQMLLVTTLIYIYVFLYKYI